jgi:hypothetical protein
MRTMTKDKEKLYPDFPGLDSPELKDWLDKTFERRNVFVSKMGKQREQDAGFPDITALRRAVQDPELRGLPKEGAPIGDTGRKLYENYGGQAIGEIFPLDRFAKSRPKVQDDLLRGSTTWLDNRTYPIRLSGEYEGGFDQPVPRSILFRDYIEGKRAAGKDPSKDYRGIQISPKSQVVDQQLIDEASKFIEDARGLGITDMLRDKFADGGMSDSERFRREANERIAADRAQMEIQRAKRAGALQRVSDYAKAYGRASWSALDDNGEAKLFIDDGNVRVPGIAYDAMQLPMLLNIPSQIYGIGASALASKYPSLAPAAQFTSEWFPRLPESVTSKIEEYAGKPKTEIVESILKQDNLEDPHGLAAHLGSSLGSMLTQVPVPARAVQALQVPTVGALNAARKVARPAVEYAAPIVSSPKGVAVGTAFGTGLGYGSEKAEEGFRSMSDEDRVGYAEGGGAKSKIGPLVQLARGAARRIGEGTGYKSVPGKPATVEIPTIGRVETLPIPELEDAAANYMRSIGRPGENVISEYPEFDEDLARRLARAYDEMKHDPSDPRVMRSYQALADETMAQLDAIKNSGLDIRFLREGMEDPYARSPGLGYADIIENNRLYTYPTDFGFGSTDANADMLSTFKHPMLTPIGRLGDKDNAVVNDAFRVVHDAFGHFGPGNPFFRHKGEERAWLNHAPMYSPEARPAAAVELRGQNSYVNFGPNAGKNATASGADTIYADQKLGLMPEWTWTERSQKKPVEKAEGGEVSQDEAQAPSLRDEISGARTLVQQGGIPALREAIDAGDISQAAGLALLSEMASDEPREGFELGGPVSKTSYDGMPFNRAFRIARRNALAGGEQTFRWNGKLYGTKLKEEVEAVRRDRQQRATQRPVSLPASANPQQTPAAPAAPMPVPPGGEVASGATQAPMATQPRPAPASPPTARPSASQPAPAAMVTPVAPAVEPYQGYPLGMNQPVGMNQPGRAYYTDLDTTMNYGSRPQSVFDMQMERFTGQPYAAMSNEVPQFKRGGKVRDITPEQQKDLDRLRESIDESLRRYGNEGVASDQFDPQSLARHEPLMHGEPRLTREQEMEYYINRMEDAAKRGAYARGGSAKRGALSAMSRRAAR